MNSPSGISNLNFFGTTTPSRLFPASPLPWSFQLTPSIFSREGITPFNGGEANPFEASFGSSKLQKAFTAEDLPTTPGDFFSLLPPRRKRALSSPVLTPGLGLGSANHFSSAFGEALASEKRPKLESEDSGSATASSTTTKFEGSVSGVDETSPISSVISPSPGAVATKTDGASDSYPLALGKGEIVAPAHTHSTGTVDSEIPFTSSYQSPFDSSTSSAPSQRPTSATSSATPRSFYEQFTFTPSHLPSLSASQPPPGMHNPAPLQHSLYSHPQAFFPGGPHGNSVPLDISVNGGSVAPYSAFLPSHQPSPAVIKSGKKGKPGASTASGAKGGRKGPKRARSDSIADDDQAEDDEEEKRKVFLERNRLAAVKSRQKKKERVGNMEAQAAEMATRNAQLQAIALGLRDEVFQLRKVLDFHDTCRCEHVAGYRHREQAGGGIPTIQALAGHTLSLNYTNVPTTGSETDCYSEVVRSQREDTPESFGVGAGAIDTRRVSATLAPIMPANMGLAIPLRSNSTSKSAEQRVVASGAPPTSNPPPSQPPSHPPSHPPSLPPSQPLPTMRTATPSIPVSPSWDPRGDSYFAIQA